MKVQFNLLPDVKLDYLKTQRTKATITTVSIIVSAASLFILVFMLINVYVVNKSKLSDANNKINDYSGQLKAIPNLNQILTVQNQLSSLSSLHQNKHVLSRVYQYLPQLVPANLNIGQLAITTSTNGLVIQGTADSQKTINTFIDTLKFTNYSLGGNDTKKNAFPSVIESQFGLTQTGASYEITIQYDPALFSNNQTVGLEVPQGLSTTRSVLDDPGLLFNGKTGSNSSNQSTQSGGQ